MAACWLTEQRRHAVAGLTSVQPESGAVDEGY